MADEQNAGAAAPMTPEAATAQKATLMADPAWRTAAMDPKGAAWGQMTTLNEAIAAHHQAAEDADAAEDASTALRTQAHAIIKAGQADDADQADDPEALAAIHAVPERPGQYDLPTQRASELGLKVDPAREIELRQALHAAEVTQSLAQVMYMAAITAAKVPDQSDASVAVRQQAEYLESAHTLHQKWGAQYDANLAIANTEARRIFEKLPASLTKGVSYADWCRSSGIANSRVVVEALLNRAKARGKAGG
jgi:hypothetical protein